MELELNIVTDKPSRNGRIYPKEVLLKALKDKKEFPIVLDIDIDIKRVDITKIQAFSKSFDISEDGKVIIETGEVFGKILKKLKDEIIPIKLNPISVGTIKDNIVSDLNLIGFSLDLEKE